MMTTQAKIDELREKAIKVCPRRTWAQQAAVDYLDANHERGASHYITPGTFCRYRLMGRSKGFISRYTHSLIAQLEELREQGLASRAKSRYDGLAYAWNTEEDEP